MVHYQQLLQCTKDTGTVGEHGSYTQNLNLNTTLNIQVSLHKKNIHIEVIEFTFSPT